MSTAASDTGLSPHRSEALSDGIFAVAMTLLVIELKLPDHAALQGAEAFARALANLAPKFMAWFFSFFVLSFFWVGNHRTFHYVRHVDGPLLAMNLALLAAVSLMPFSCALVGEHATVLLAQVLYSSNLILLSVISLAMARYVHRHPDPHAATMTKARYESARLRILGLIAVSGLAIGIAAVAPGAGNIAYMLMGVINPLSRRRERAQERAGGAPPLAGA